MRKRTLVYGIGTLVLCAFLVGGTSGRVLASDFVSEAAEEETHPEESWDGYAEDTSLAPAVSEDGAVATMFLGKQRSLAHILPLADTPRHGFAAVEGHQLRARVTYIYSKVHQSTVKQSTSGIQSVPL